jgi:hypothetical protein
MQLFIWPQYLAEPQHVEGCVEGCSLIIMPSLFLRKNKPVPSDKSNRLIIKKENGAD